LNTHFLSSFLCALAPLRDSIFPVFFYLPVATFLRDLCGEIPLFVFLLFNSNFYSLCPASVPHELSGNSRLIGVGWQKLSVLIPCKSVSNKIWRKKGSIKNILFMQNKPNFPKTEMNITSVLIKPYANIPLHDSFKNKAKRTQSNPISEKLK